MTAAVLRVAEQVETRLRANHGDGPGDGRGDGVLQVVYRLLLLRLARERGAVVTSEQLPGPEAEREWLQGCADDLVVEDPGADALPWRLAALHARVLEARSPERRRARGAFFTPAPLVAHLLDHALEPTLDAADPSAVTVLDPSCGPGLFLVEAARRIARRGVPLERAVQQVRGTDLDAAALELARGLLWLELVRPGEPLALPPLPLRCDDALLGEGWPEAVDVVVGNPPFLNQLERRTRADRRDAQRLRAGDTVLGPYTDLSAVFLHRAVGWVRDGGRVALVQPQSLLAARDAAGVRRRLADTCALEHLWASDTPVFDAHVVTCAPVLRRGAGQGTVTLSHGPLFTAVAPSPAPDLSGEWSHLLAAGLGIPRVQLSTSPAGEAGGRGGVVGDLAACTADFRDQYYGLADVVHEHADLPGGVPLVTSGLVEPAACLWGRAPTRFLKRRWAAPVVDVPAIEDERLARWAQARLVPKLLVGTQGRVVEAVADEAGAWLPSVPTITVVPARDRLWHVLAVLLAPPVTAFAATAYAGTALSMRAVKLSARQVAALPLPVDRGAWDEGAAAVRAAQLEGAADDRLRVEHLLAAGRAMCAAYRVEPEVLAWWADRARVSAPR